MVKVYSIQMRVNRINDLLTWVYRRAATLLFIYHVDDLDVITLYPSEAIQIAGTTWHGTLQLSDADQQFLAFVIDRQFAELTQHIHAHK